MFQSVVNGVSTRKVAEITEELCGTRISKSLVSELCKRLDPMLTAWNNRPLDEQMYPFVIVDAMVIRIREDNRVRHRSILIAVGIGDSESEDSWSDFFAWLKERGLSGVNLVVSDQHGGLVKAIRKHFQGVSWQRCQTHFRRNILDATPNSLRDEVKTRVRAILDSPDMEIARSLLTKTLDTFEKKAPKAMKVLETGFEDALTVLALPQKYRKRLRTTNGLERLNEETKSYLNC